MIRKWEDWINLILGIWLIFAPYVLGFAGVAMNSVWVGILVALVAIWALAMPGNRLAEWSNLLLGAGFFISPWVLGFADFQAAAWNAWIVGGLVALLSVIAIPQAARIDRLQDRTDTVPPR